MSKASKTLPTITGKNVNAFSVGEGGGEKGSTNLLKQETSSKQCRFKSLSTALQLSNCFPPALCSPLCCFSDFLSAIGCTTNNNNITIKAAALQQKLLACLLYPSPSPLLFPFPSPLLYPPSLSPFSSLTLLLLVCLSLAFKYLSVFEQQQQQKRKKREKRGQWEREREIERAAE